MDRDLIHERQIGNVLIQTYTMFEYTQPKYVFEFQEDIDAIHSGEVDYFAAMVEVRFGPFIGTDYLGCCAYKDSEDFIGQDYWHDMVREAVRDCRRTILHQQKTANEWARRLRKVK